MRIGWIVANTTANIASTRYRCYYPALALAEHGVESTVFAASQDVLAHLNQLDAIVFVKRLDSDSVRLATEARAFGKRIYIDLCDNVVIPNYEGDATSQQVPWLVAVSAIADAIITTNTALTESLKPVLSARVQFCEIPDQTETRTSVEKAYRFSEISRGRARSSAGRRLGGSMLTQRISLLSRTAMRNPGHFARVLQRKLAEIVRNPRQLIPPPSDDRQKTAAENIVLWFGNFGSPYSDFGMLSLLRAAPSLEMVARDIDFELLVVSNNRTMFENCIAPLALRTRYVEWSPNAVFNALQTATVCLLPSGLDAFSLTKSANRAVLALQHGVPVISSKIRSLEPLAASIAFDDWEGGLRRFLGSAPDRRNAVAAAGPTIDALFSAQAIATAWLNLLETSRPSRLLGMTNVGGKHNIGVVIDLIQDVDVLLPVIDEIRSHDAASLRVILTDFVAKQSPRAIRALIEREIIPYYLERRSALASDRRTLAGLDCIITASESSLAAHQTCHAIVVLARQLGISTFTLQHGLENVGLTYFDDTHGDDVSFASDHILTWVHQHQLPTRVQSETLRKCIGVGRARRAELATTPRPAEWGSKSVVGVFENLHWHRYSRGYREAFARDLVGMAESREDIIFVVKPHHAGLFLVKESSQRFSSLDNVFLLDPRDPRWEPYTAGALLRHCAVAITTPSSVALDAAELDIPVGVAAYDLEVAAYAPLPMLHNVLEWQNLVEASLTRNQGTLRALREFRDRVRIPGDAAKRTVELVLDYCSSPVSRRPISGQRMADAPV